MIIQPGETGHAILMLHGLCGSPLELGSVPKALARSSHTIAWPKLPGYNDPKHCTPWTEWVETAELQIAKLKSTHTSVSICGLSMGATLALAIAARDPSIQSLALLSPILRYDGWAISRPLLFALNVAYRFGFRNWQWQEKDPYGIRNPELRKRVARAAQKGEMSEVGAATLSARHLYQAQQLMRHVRRNLVEIQADTLVIHAVDDETAAPRNAEEILEGIRSETRKAIWLGDCYHIITVDNEREIVTNETVRFIESSLARSRGDDIHRKSRTRQSLRDRR